VLESYEEDGMNSYISKRSFSQRVKEEEKEDRVQSSAGRVLQSSGPGVNQPVIVATRDMLQDK